MEKLNTVLRKVSTNKALGPDHWHPRELMALLTELKNQFIGIIHEAENEGEWPEGLRTKPSTLSINPALSMRDN